MTTISDAILQVWQTHGYVQIPQLLSPELVNDVSRWVADLARFPTTPAGGDSVWQHFEQTENGTVLARTEYFLDFHPGFHDLLTRGAIPEILGQILGEPVVLYKEKINYKYPGGAGYAPHQDAAAYLHGDSHLTCAIAIDPATPENGCLYFAAGQHQRGLLARNEQGCIVKEVCEQMIWIPEPLAAGDGLVFSSYAPHFSPPNRTKNSRRTLYLTYNALREGNLREKYYQDKRDRLKHNPDSAQLSLIGHFQGRPVSSSL
jgi:hypothetical protein